MTRMRQARIKAGMSQAELAERIGVSQTLVSKVERGMYAPNGETLLSICKVLGIEPAHVVKDCHS